MLLPTSWTEIIILFSVLQGTILCIALGTKGFAKSSSNKTLFLFLLSLVFLLFAGIKGEAKFLLFIKKGMAYIGDTVSFLYGPLLFLYARKLLFNEKNRHVWRHFIPAIIFFIINVITQVIGIEILGIAFFTKFYLVLSVFVFVQLYCYLWLSIKVVFLYKKQVNQELSYIPSVNYLLTIIGLVASAFILFFMSFLNDQLALGLTLVFMDYNSVWIIISLITFVLAWYAMIKPELFRLTNAPLKKVEVDLKEIHHLKQELIEQMINHKVYLDPDLSLAIIADNMNVRKELVSKVLNHGLSKNFYRFVNEYRIAEFKRLVEQEDARQFTHLALAYDAGFKSKTTFYKAFKEITGSTPSEYLKVS